MKRMWRLGIAAWCALLMPAWAAAADLAITHARLIDGKGQVIDDGTLVIDGGKIVSIGKGPAPRGTKQVIDARGRTVMPGFIDAHRHIGGKTSPKDMQDWLDAGFTTVLDALGDVDALAALRKRIETGEIAGPRLRISGFVPVNQVVMPQGVTDAGRADPARVPLRERKPIAPIPLDAARAMVRAFAAKGVDNVKTVLVASPDGAEIETMRAVADEAHKHGMRYLVHATSVDDTLVAIAGHADILAHTPHEGWVDEGSILQRIVAAGLPMDTTLGVFTPYFGLEGNDIMRDMHAFPDDTLHSAGQGPANARLLWKAGIKLAYGTDTGFSPSESLRHELYALVPVFSAQDIVTMLTANAAIAAGVSGETGTLEPGKAADVVMLAGDPLADIFATLHPVLVLRAGKVVADRRSAR
jgi:imidazolonepropionase-like amidohydrolase